ncbi:hypothetical protein VNO77_42990 [Canavalia gladiata]|uniref:Disease resistance RPP13-like protein 4 n=1 Tax=Canavalia gladiata TaxID=3824 RepID=A0AAN9PMJ5_CANGL
MSIRTNPLKAVPLLQKRLIRAKMTEKIPVVEKLENLMVELNNIKDLFSTVERNKEELLDTLTSVDDLLRNFSTQKFREISLRILHSSSDATKANQHKGESFQAPMPLAGDGDGNGHEVSETGNVKPNSSRIEKTSSSQETQDRKSEEKEVPIDVKLESLKSELENMKAQFSTAKKNEELYGTLRAVEDLLRNFNAKNFSDIVKSAEDANQSETNSSNLSSQASKSEVLDQVLKTISKNIKDSTQKLQPVGVSQSKAKAYDSLGQTSKTGQKYPILSLSEHNNEKVDLVLKRIQVSYDALNLHSRICLLSLSIFPENEVIKKRHTIYWWIGEGFVRNSRGKTAEEEGEEIFDELLSCNLIVPHGNNKCPIVNKFKINPWIRHMLLSSVLKENNQYLRHYSQISNSSLHDDIGPACLVLDQEKVKISDLTPNNWRTIFNVGARYLSFGPQWIARMKLVVLQLGRWQESPSYHIEVESTNFLNDLKDQKHLKYLSLRGLSRISELPRSIDQLISLEILDLKACHNLETLPDEIALLRKLTHLDVSQCYLLESMPKGIEKLIELQVLKGFVIGSSSKTPCRISDLAKLKQLKRLSIHIGSEAVIQDGEFESLKDLEAVKRLKISWGVLSNIRYKDNIFLPLGLEKLDLEGYPRETIPEWLQPGNLPSGLKKLYIKGGKLTSMWKTTGEKGSKCEIVRLKYLNHLHIDPNLQEIFPSLRYAEKRHVFFNQFYEWSIDEESESMSMPK